ncbi:MAG: metallophosphoesterase [Spirochaetes bacterium]|nr:metallophosphoesterase [Spirochaetota bacterium]
MDKQRLLVLSDIHGEEANLKTVFQWGKNRPEGKEIGTSVFLGDGAADIKKMALIEGFYSEWIMVRGNNDFDNDLPETCTLDFSGYRFFLCHGHKHSIYLEHEALIAAALKEKADVALFGHTHTPFYSYTHNILLINPGSVGRPRTSVGATFAVIECAQGQPFKTEFWGVKQGEVHAVKHIFHE